MKTLRPLLSLLVAFAATFFSTAKTEAAVGWFNDYVLVSNNGGADAYYWIGGNPGFGTEFNGATITITYGQTLEIGADMKYWASDGDNRTGGAFYWRMNSNSFTEQVWSHASLGGNDYQGTYDSTINVVSGLNAGSHTLSIYAKSWGSSGGDSFLSNGGSNYVANITINKANQSAVSGTLGSSTIDFGSTTTVTASGGSGTGAYEFRQNGGTGSVSFTGSGSSRTINTTTAGTAVIEVRRVADTNYNDSSWVSAGTLTINAPAAAITINSGTSASATAFTTTYGTASAEQTFTIAGTNLTANIAVAAVTGFEYSIDGGSTWGTTRTITQSGGSASATLRVRLAATAAANGTYNSQSITLSSTGATNRSISTSASGNTVSKKALTITANATSIIYGNPVTDITSPGPGYVASGFVNGDTSAVISGSVTYTTSYTQGTAAGTGGVTVTPVVTGLSATNYSFSAANGAVTVSSLDNPSMTATASSDTHTATRVYLTMTKWEGRNVMIVRNTSDSFTAPTQGSAYSVNGTIGSGIVVYNGSGTTATEDNLVPGVTYYYKIYSENYSYYSAGAATVSVTTNTPTARNSSGSASPNAPGTIYLGDNNHTFGLEAWGSVTSAGDDKWGRARLAVRHNNSDLSSATMGNYTGFTNTNARTVSSGTFNQTGTWYWGIEMDYSYSGATPARTYWYKASNADWTALATNGTGSSLSFTVNALNDPSGLTATANSTTAIDLAWTKGTSGDAKDTIIVRRQGSAVATDPIQGTTYNASDSLGDGVVVYRGGDSSFQDTGLTAGTTYHYKIYSENWSYYSPGITGSTSTLPNPPVVTGETFAGTVGSAFSQTVSATNSPTSYALASGSLPAGLSLNTSTGAITGTPTAAGSGTSVTITATNAGGTSSAATFTFNIAKGASTISVTGSTSFTYTGSPQGPDGHSKTGSTGAVTFSYSGTGGTTYSASATKPTNVGTYLATATVAADSNYEAQTSDTYAFSITQATQSITFGALDGKTYGDASFALGATASSGLSVSYASSNTSVATVSGSTVTIVGAGSTTITASQAGDSNYSAASNANQTLTVAQKSLTGTFTANNKTYDGATSATVATRAVTGKVGDDDVNHTGGTATFANANVGNGKTVTLAGATLTGAAAANYSLGSVSTTTANITVAALTITANATSKVYNNTLTNPTTGSTAFTSSGLQNSETIGSVTLTYSGGYNATDAAGTYDITPSAATGGTFTASNYNISYVAGTLTVSAIAPAVSTGTAGSITTTGAVITGSDVTSAGGGTISARGVVYGTSANPALGGGNTTVADGSNTTGSFNSTLTGLTGGTTYHVRAYVTTGHSTAYGTSISFTTEADVPAKVTLSRAHTPVSNGFTVAWTDVASETGYNLHYSTNATFEASVTEVNGIDANTTSYGLTGLTPGTTYYVRVRGVSAGGNGTWSDTQVNQLQSIANGVTRYMSAPGATATGNYTVADIFGSSNEAGLASGANTSSATTIKTVYANGTTSASIFRNNSSQWVQGPDDSAGAVVIGRGKAFILQNTSGSTDYFLLVGTGTDVPAPEAVTISPGAALALVAPGRTKPTPFTDFVASVTTTSTPTAADHFKASGVANLADQIIVPGEPGQPAKIYFYHPTAKGGASWMVNGLKITDPSRPAGSDNIPTGAGVFIRKAGGSTLETFTPPAE